MENANNLPQNANWMRFIDGETLLSSLTIPGTHDTGTWKLGGFYKCQSIDLNSQLQAGIRFLDIRLKPSGKNDALQVWHGGDGNAKLEFTTDIVATCQAFLYGNPSETIIMSIKDESKTYMREEAFHNRLWADMASYGGLFYTEDRIPELAEVRGKIVFFRRNWAPLSPYPIGINAYGKSWPDNSTTRWTNSANISFTVQDEYKTYSRVALSRKFERYVKPVLEEAGNDPISNGRLYINFTSGTGDFYPETLSKKTNQLLIDYLEKNAQTRFGIIPMDFPENAQYLISRLIECNYKDPLRLPRCRDRNTGAIYLTFDGQLHHVPSPAIADKLFGQGWDWRALPNIHVGPEEANGAPLNRAYIIKFVGSHKRYVCYEEPQQAKPTLRHIPNTAAEHMYGLFGATNELPIDEIDKYDIKSNLTLFPILKRPLKDGDVVAICSFLDIDSALDSYVSPVAVDPSVILNYATLQNSQQWRVSEVGENRFHFENAAGNKILDVCGNNAANNTPIIISTPNGGKNQQWNVIASDEDPDVYMLVPENALESCLDVSGFRVSGKTPIILHKQKNDHDRSNQLWYFQQLSRNE